MKRALCWLFGHRTLPGVSRHLSILHWCPRCNRLVAGELSEERGR